MKVYIAGPMTGYEFYNFAEFDRVAAILEELGHTPINPADLSRKLIDRCGYDPEDEQAYSESNGFKKEDFMEQDICAMRGAESLVLLAGWDKSKGANVELAYARYRGIPVYSSVDEFEYITKQGSQLKAA